MSLTLSAPSVQPGQPFQVHYAGHGDMTGGAIAVCPSGRGAAFGLASSLSDALSYVNALSWQPINGASGTVILNAPTLAGPYDVQTIYPPMGGTVEIVPLVVLGAPEPDGSPPDQTALILAHAAQAADAAFTAGNAALAAAQASEPKAPKAANDALQAAQSALSASQVAQVNPNERTAMVAAEASRRAAAAASAAAQASQSPAALSAAKLAQQAAQSVTPKETSWRPILIAGGVLGALALAHHHGLVGRRSA